MPEGGVGDAEEGTETVQAPWLSETDRRFLLRRTQVPALRLIFSRQAWLRQQVAACPQGIPAEAPAVHEVSGAGQVCDRNGR